MAKYSAIKAAVNAYIKANGRKEITGSILNAVLNATIDSLGRFYQFAGGALPTDDPGTPDQNVCYLATEPGLYIHFNNIRINNEEVALLFWDGTWRKNSILIGIREVDAYVDNNSGTPSVDVSYNQGRLVLSFHNLKGDKGDTGDPAGFGTIGADITGGVGTPGVSVDYSGDNAAKNLMFHFTNLKGEAGVTSVVATIDDTSGLPSCQVSLVNGVLTLAFSGLKGLKGDTGVSADYPITIYNGLDSDATDMALAAAQGKILDGKIGQLRERVDDLEDVRDEFVEVTLTPSVNRFNKAAVTPNKYIDYESGAEANSSTGWDSSEFIDISNEQDNNMYITGSAFSGYAGWACYNAQREYTHGGHTFNVTLQTGDVYVRFSVKDTDKDTAMLTPGTAADVPGEYAPFDPSASYSLKQDIIKERNIEDGAVGTDKIADGAVTADKIAPGAMVVQDGSVTTQKIAEQAVTEQKTSFIMVVEHKSTNLLNPATCVLGYIRSSDGEYRDVTQDRYATDFIPVDSSGIYLNCYNRYGTGGGYAVYDANKQYLRGGTDTSFDYAFQPGDAFIRITISTNGLGTSSYVVKATDPHVYVPYFEPYYTKSLSPDIAVPTPSDIPVYEPALSLAGKPGTKGTGNTLANNTILLDGYPQYIKRCFNLSACGRISSFEQIDIGVGKDSSTGVFLRVDGTNIYFCRYNQGNPYNVFTQAHGLTISEFLDVSVFMDDGEMTARIATHDGVFKHTFNRQVNMESYGVPFVTANANTSLSDFAFRAAGVRFRMPIWIVGDSYCSWYGERWVKQLSTSFDVTDFLLDGLAGGGSGTMFAELQKMLNYGTPKFLVWCLGMNDNFGEWSGIFNMLKQTCENNGITLVLQTIPFPEDNPTGAEQKALINAEIKASGYRYFDGYAAVSSDDNGTWYEGYCADGVHTTTEGAKAMAARFLVDFPEILQ